MPIDAKIVIVDNFKNPRPNAIKINFIITLQLNFFLQWKVILYKERLMESIIKLVWYEIKFITQRLLIWFNGCGFIASFSRVSFSVE